MIKEISICFILCAIIPIASSEWRQLQGKGNDISARGDEVWIVAQDRKIYRWSADDGDWQLQPGLADRIAASPDGSSWITSTNDDIYRMNVDTGSWETMPGSMWQISAISKDSAIGVTRQNAVYLWQNDAWHRQPIPGNGKGAWVCIGEEDERWMVLIDRSIFRWNHDQSDWVHMPGNAVRIDCQSPDKIVKTDADQFMHVWRKRDWVLLPGRGVRATVGNKNVYTVAASGDLFVTPFPASSTGKTAAKGTGAAAKTPAKAAGKTPAKATAQKPAAAADAQNADFQPANVQNVDQELDDNFNVVVTAAP